MENLFKSVGIRFVFVGLLFLVTFFPTLNVSAQSWRWVNEIKTIDSANCRTVVMSHVLDSSNNVYVVGHFFGKAIFGSIVLTAPSEFEESFIAKYNSIGEFLWVKQVGGVDRVRIHDVVIDKQNHLFITGHAEGDTFSIGNYLSIVPPMPPNPRRFLFVAKLDTAGQVLWCIRETGTTVGQSLTVDDFGNLYVTGWYRFANTFGTNPPSTQVVISGGNWRQGFIAKYDANGILKWVRNAFRRQTSQPNPGYRIEYSSCVVDRQGNVYASGGFNDTLYVQGFPDKIFTNGLQDIFYCKYDSLGNPIWLKRFGGIDNDGVGGLIVNHNNEICITGSFYNTIVFDNDSLNSFGETDGFFCRLNSDGNVLSVSRFGGLLNDSYGSIFLDKFNNYHIIGQFSSKTGFVSDSLYSQSLIAEAFFTKFDSNLNFIYAYALNSQTSQSFSSVDAISVDTNLFLVMSGRVQDSVDFGGTLTATISNRLESYVAQFPIPHIWNGSQSHEWDNIFNWNQTIVPTNVHNVIIPNVTNQPIIEENYSAFANNLNIQIGADLTLLGKLKLTDGLRNNGELRAVKADTLILAKGDLVGSGIFQISNLKLLTNGVVNSSINIYNGCIIGENSVSASPIFQSDALLNLNSNADTTAYLFVRPNSLALGQLSIIQNRYLPVTLAGTDLGYRYLSSPITNATPAQINNDLQLTITHPFSPVNGGSGNFTLPFPNFFTHHESYITSASTPDIFAWETPNDLNQLLPQGKGFILNSSANDTISLQGIANINGLTVMATNTANATQSGYNLLGNPYPAVLNLKTFLDQNPTLEQTVWLRNATAQYSGDWVQYNAATQQTIPLLADNNGLLPIMQGFFVRTPTTTAVSFNKDQAAIPQSNLFYKNGNQMPKLNIVVDIEAPNNRHDQVCIFATDSTTNAFDPATDSRLIQYNSASSPTLYSITGGQKVKFNGVSIPNVHFEVPIHVYAPTSGIYKFRFPVIQLSSTLLNLYLSDSTSGGTLYHLVDANNPITVSISQGEHIGRFKLVANSQPLANSGLNNEMINIYPNPSNGTFYIEANEINQIAIFDIVGKQVEFDVLKGDGLTSVQLWAKGLYFVHITTNTKKIVRSVLVE